MKKRYLYKLFVFLIPVLLVLLSMELFYRAVPNNYTFKNEILSKNQPDIKVLIFGNSHTFYGLNPEFFTKPTVNVANISQSIYFDQLLFENYIKNFQNLKFVVLNVEYFSLSQIDNSDEDRWRKFYYQTYMNLDVPMISSFEIQNYFLSGTRNFSTNVDLVKEYLDKGTLINCDENGFGANYTKEKRVKNLIEFTSEIVKKHEDSNLDFALNVSRIEAIATQCKSLGIKVILVTMPVTKGYAEQVNSQKISKIFKTCAEIETRDDNVSYLNLFSDKRFSDDDFYDVDHLHGEGAQKCSEIVSKFLQIN